MEKLTPLQSFMALANFDQSLNEIRYSLDLLNSEHTRLNDDLLVLQSQIDASRQEFCRIQKLVHNHELAMKELDTNLQKHKDLLDKVTNQREYTAVKNTINQIKQEQHNYETILVDEWNKLDNAKVSLESKQQKAAQQIEAIKLQISQKITDLTKLNSELADQIQKREQFLKNVPVEWLEKYEAMYTKVSNPIVQLLNNACGACFHEATSQVFIDLKHHKLIQCKGCFRFLFF